MFGRLMLLLGVWAQCRSRSGQGRMWGPLWSLNATVEVVFSSGEGQGEGGPVKVWVRGIKGSGLSWQWSKCGNERAAGAKAGDLCVSGGEAGRAEGRCVGQRVVGLGGIKKKMTEMSAGRMVRLFIEMGKSQREGALRGGGGDRKES